MSKKKTEKTSDLAVETVVEKVDAPATASATPAETAPVEKPIEPGNVPEGERPEGDPVDPDASIPEPEAGGAEALQHPALAGEEDLEIGKRTIDDDPEGDDGTPTPTPEIQDYRKVIRIGGPGVKFDARSYVHDANIAAVRQELITSGLRPTGDIEYLGYTKLDDEGTIDLEYGGPVAVAAVATDPEVVHAEVIQG